MGSDARCGDMAIRNFRIIMAAVPVKINYSSGVVTQVLVFNVINKVIIL